MLLLGTLEGFVQVVMLHEPHTTHSLRLPITEEGASPAPAILRLAISSDGQWCTTADSASQLHVYSLDALSCHTTLPQPSAMPTALAFLPGSSLVAVAGADLRLTVYDVDRCTTVRSIGPLGAAIASPLGGGVRHEEAVLRISVNPSKPNSVMLCAQTWLYSVTWEGASDFAAPANAGQATETGSRNQRRKRRRSKSESGGGDDGRGQLVTKYGPILLFDFLADDTAVVVEQPWLRVMEHLPPALHRHRFGT